MHHEAGNEDEGQGEADDEGDDAGDEDGVLLRALGLRPQQAGVKHEAAVRHQQEADEDSHDDGRGGPALHTLADRQLFPTLQDPERILFDSLLINAQTE